MADVKFSELTALAAADVASADILAIVDTSASVSKKITIDSLFGAVPVNIAVEDTTNSTSTTTGSIQTDGGIGAAKSVVVGDDLSLKSDAAVLNFGADSDVSLTHYADNGLLVNSTRKIYFEDGVNYDQYIGSAGSGVTAVAAPTEIDLTASTIDINGAVDVSSTLSVTSGITGLSTLTMTGNILPAASGTVDIGSASAEFNDVYLADSSVLNFGSDQDTTLTHTDGSGLALNSTNKLGFGGVFTEAISSSTSGQLDIVAGTEVQIDTTTVDLNGALDVSSTLTIAGVSTLQGNTTIGSGAAGVDYTLTFNGETNDGVITWSEDEDYFTYSDAVLMSSTTKVNFGDTGTFVHQSADGVLDVTSDTTLDLTAPTITLTGGGTASSVLKHATDGYDLEIQQGDGAQVARVFDGGATPTTGFAAVQTATGGFGYKRRVISFTLADTSASTLTAADSGSFIEVIGSGTGFADLIDLPLITAVDAGWWCEFYVTTVLNGSDSLKIRTSGHADATDGFHLVLLNNATSSQTAWSAGNDILTIPANAPVGTYVKLTAVKGGAAEYWLAEATQPSGTSISVGA